MITFDTILSNTIEHYGMDTSRLSYNEYGNPAYFLKNGKRCAITRLIKSKYRKLLREYDMKMRDSIRLVVEDFMKENGVSENSAIFELFGVDATIRKMEDLQEFHDDKYNWMKEMGLTKLGIQYLFTFFPEHADAIKSSVRKLKERMTEKEQILEFASF